jgi:hypothetical protein
VRCDGVRCTIGEVKVESRVSRIAERLACTKLGTGNHRPVGTALTTELIWTGKVFYESHTRVRVRECVRVLGRVHVAGPEVTWCDCRLLRPDRQ